MPNRRIYIKCDIPKSVTALVVALCVDYDRRKSVINGVKDVPSAHEAKCMELNLAIDKALLEVEVGIRREILRDIIEGRGYQRSKIVIVCKGSYYKIKRKLLYDIAKNLLLL